MCGIVGYAGGRPALGIVLDGLRRLEYRGYDSAGVAVVAGGALSTEKRAGKLANLEKLAVVTRGSGTGLSGGSLPNQDCIVLCTVKMEKILELDRANLTLLTEPGVTTLNIA